MDNAPVPVFSIAVTSEVGMQGAQETSVLQAPTFQVTVAASLHDCGVSRVTIIVYVFRVVPFWAVTTISNLFSPKVKDFVPLPLVLAFAWLAVGEISIEAMLFATDTL
jgi:hypothetical protein